MTQSAEQVIAIFDALPEGEKREVIATLLRKAESWTHEPMSDEELVAAADEVFMGLDEYERDE